MDTLSVFGYLGALLVGIILGLIGGGGSILTVPILVYLIGLNPVTATAYSLFVVGTTSIFGAIQHIKDKSVNVRIAILFAIPALITVYLTRRFLVPAIPESLFTFLNIEVTKHIFIMLFFALIMIIASFSMIKSSQSLPLKNFDIKHNTGFVIVEGILVGTFTGIVGAGGGFLIVPTLVIVARLPMRLAIGTSLIIIAMKSLIGFLGDVQNIAIDWPFLIMFTSISVVGIYIGIYMAKFISGTNLKKGFGWFTLLMAGYIIFKELSIV
jgi:uncharacterized protein